MSKSVVRSAETMLASHPHFCELGRTFQLTQEGDRLIVEGNVPTFYLKQILQHALLALDGSLRIENRVRVSCYSRREPESNQFGGQCHV